MASPTGYVFELDSRVSCWPALPPVARPLKLQGKCLRFQRTGLELVARPWSTCDMPNPKTPARSRPISMYESPSSPGTLPQPQQNLPCSKTIPSLLLPSLPRLLSQFSIDTLTTPAHNLVVREAKSPFIILICHQLLRFLLRVFPILRLGCLWGKMF